MSVNMIAANLRCSWVKHDTSHFSEIRSINRYWSRGRYYFGAIGELSPQLTALFTSATILASSAAVNPFSAKAAGHMLPSSRFALSLKPNVAYLVLNFAAAWKKQTTLSSLAYAGIPYQSLGVRACVLSLMILWRRLAMVRSGSRISAIFARTALSPSPLPAFISWTRSLIAPRSSSVNALLVAVMLLLADFCLPFCAGFMEFDSISELNYFSPVRSSFQSCLDLSL